MKSLKSALLVVLAAAITPACVKLKDKNEEDQTPQAVVRSFETQSLTVDQPLYLINGEFLRYEDFVKAKEQNFERSLGDQVEYELHFDHLFFKEGGVLFTMGQVVRIFVQDLDSRGGKIVSMPEGVVSPIMADGLSGGSIALKVQQARGDFMLIMTGGKGGPGLKGAMGLDGNSGGEIRSVFIRSGLSVFCKIGGRGGTGSQGARGGASGVAEVELPDEGNFDFRAIRQAGKGGDGGEGGDGGITRGAEICEHLVFKRGERGSSGAQGVEGIIQEVCVKKGSGRRQCL